MSGMFGDEDELFSLEIWKGTETYWVRHLDSHQRSLTDDFLLSLNTCCRYHRQCIDPFPSSQESSHRHDSWSLFSSQGKSGPRTRLVEASQAIQQCEHAGRKHPNAPTLRTDTVKQKRLALLRSNHIRARLNPAHLLARTITDAIAASMLRTFVARTQTTTSRLVLHEETIPRHKHNERGTIQPHHFSSSTHSLNHSLSPQTYDTTS
jgi:hypothetical protein